MESQIAWICLKELSQLVLDLSVVHLNTVQSTFLFHFLVVNSKGNAIVFVPSKSNGANSSLVKTQREGFNVAAQAWVLVQ